jgi:hypothetical protein
MPFTDHIVGHTETRGDANFGALGDATDDDFLSRERALLGDDANQFTSPGDRVATVEDGGDDDLLGGGDFHQGTTGEQEMAGFEDSFPAIDTTNDVCHAF